MSLVDAIRQAALNKETTAKNNQVQCMKLAVDDDESVTAPVTIPVIPVQPSNISSNASQTLVRLELMLSQEQFQELLRGLINGVHSVMTLREAAHYLRVPFNVLQSMVENAQIPGFLIDGKWRFSKQSLDDWMTQARSSYPQKNELKLEEENAG